MDYRYARRGGTISESGPVGFYWQITLLARRGHNPFEPLKAGCRTACGPYMSNWDDSCFHLRDYLTVLKTDAAIAKWITEDRIPPVPYVFEKKNLSFRLACQILTTISDNK